ncbi:hypothetical protein FC82_GL002336 [Secundilactobacillus collinoides DSM 20515 = JCM 1123]|uniref:Preprotein translocase subunit SecE n=1 Tax=Secundilactobacillus collinoides DSM 20515 = JCM 1123 TaxID=1423733 RepID=A0A0R2B821_SECCO|nr:hypothetical protein FC82_GL002336 [Secundilactobacillus collinoides DSM 20515 = JCM 1123]
MAVKDEMKQVSWPNAKQTRKDVSSVLWLAISMAIFLGLVDYLVQAGLKILAS